MAPRAPRYDLEPTKAAPPARFTHARPSERRMRLLDGLVNRPSAEDSTELPPLPRPGDPLDALDEQVLAIALKDQAHALALAATRHTGLSRIGRREARKNEWQQRDAYEASRSEGVGALRR